MSEMDLFAKGWECPKCGAVMSPITSVCVNCRGNVVTNKVTAESAISEFHKAAKDFKNAPPEAFLGLNIGKTMDL